MIINNRVVTDKSRLFAGIRIVGSNAYISGNTVSAQNPVVNGYGSSVRGLGIAFQEARAFGAQIIGNTTKGFDVGVGPFFPGRVLEHTVIDHTSIGDQLGLDPLGLITE